MNKFTLAFAALAVLATPMAASAQSFTGPRIEATVGFDDVTQARDTSKVLYGLNAGIDAPINNSNFRIGVEVTTDQLFDRNRDIGVGARLGYVFNDKVMVYGKGGYANYRNIDFRNRATALDGFRVGGGVEYALTKNLYTKVEYRYSDFNGNVGKHGGLAGVGLRF